MKSLKLFFTAILLTIFSTNTFANNITGQVTDAETNEPIAGATVYFYQADPITPDSIFFSAETGIDGSYLIENVDNGYYFAGVEHPEYHPTHSGPYEINGDTTINFVMHTFPQTQSSISGTIFDHETLEPIAGANVALFRMHNYPFREVTANDSGAYVFENIPPGKYKVRASAEEYLPGVTEDWINIGFDTQVSGVDLFLAPDNGTFTASLSGEVYYFGEDSTQIPIADAEIKLFNPGTGIHYETLSNDLGLYEFTDIHPGEYFIHAFKDGFMYRNFDNPSVIITPGANTFDIIMTKMMLPPLGTIEGHVTFDGSNEPAVNAVIHFLPAYDIVPAWDHFTAVPDSAGFYSAEIPEGTYYVLCKYHYSNFDFPYFEFYDDAMSIEDATPVEVVENQTTADINFGIPQLTTYNLSVSGTVLDEDGNVIPEARVHLTFRNGPNAGYVTDSLFAFTNENGEYTIEVPELSSLLNTFVVSACKEGYYREFYDNKPEFFLADEIVVSGLNDTMVTNIDFSLQLRNEPGEYSISGTVSSGDTVLIQNAFVAAFGLHTGHFGFGITDGDGHYTIGNLPQGIYYVLFYAAGYAPQFYDNAMRWENASPIMLFSNADGIDANLLPISFGNAAGSISGQIAAGNGTPLSGVMVSIQNNNGDVVGYNMTDAQGTYLITGLSSDNYSVLATKVNYQSDVQNVLVDLNSSVSYGLNFNLDNSTTGVNDDQTTTIPSEFILGNNYPNPFNPSTKISFSLPNASLVTLSVYNIIGEKVTTLINRNMSAGTHSVQFNAEKLNSGVYFYRIEAGSFTSTKKMILMK